MRLNDVLVSLLDPVNATGKTHIVTADTIWRWPADALKMMLEAHILSAMGPAQSIVCDGCEHQCFMDVHHIPGTADRPNRAFVVCDVPEKLEQMGRILVPEERLRRWKVTPAQIAEVVADLLGIESRVKDHDGDANIRIGLLKGKNGRRWVSLNKSPLALEVNGHQLLVSEALFFDQGVLVIDGDQIARLIDKPIDAAKKYIPRTEKREAQKRNTEAKYEDWREEYRRLKTANPEKSDTWCSIRIAKLPIARKSSPETIRKMMKT